MPHSHTPEQSSAAPSAAAPRPHEHSERTYWSQSLGREQPYACYLPPDAGESRERYPLLVLLHGLSGSWRDWGAHTRLARYIARKRLIVVCPDGGDGWYTNAADGGDRREDDLMQDLLPHLESSLPVLAPPHRAIGGLSMGGYGAIKLALKYPRSFSLVISHSGALDITTRGARSLVFGDPDTHATLRKRENPAWLAEQALCRPANERPAILMDCGASDELAAANQSFSDQLRFLGYGHTYVELPGYHTWPYWDRALRTVLPEIERRICNRPVHPGSP